MNYFKTILLPRGMIEAVHLVKQSTAYKNKRTTRFLGKWVTFSKFIPRKIFTGKWESGVWVPDTDLCVAHSLHTTYKYFLGRPLYFSGVEYLMEFLLGVCGMNVGYCERPSTYYTEF